MDSVSVEVKEVIQQFIASAAKAATTDFPESQACPYRPYHRSMGDLKGASRAIKSQSCSIQLSMYCNCKFIF